MAAKQPRLYIEASGERMRVRFRHVVLLLAAATLVGSLAVLWSVRRAAEPGRLSTSQWHRLVERMKKRTVLRRRPPAGSGAVLPSAAPAVQPPGRPPASADAPELLARQAADYEADRPKTVIDLQQWRRTQTIAIDDGAGRSGTASLVNLNPVINSWFLLHLHWSESDDHWYHLANPYPEGQDVLLDGAFPHGVVLANSERRVPCDLWSTEANRSLERAAESRSPYVLLCGERVVLRLPTTGNRTTLEWATDFLRDNVWGGEKVTVLVRSTLFKDAFVATSELTRQEEAAAATEGSGAACPPTPRLNPMVTEDTVEPVDLGISLENATAGRVTVGRWYAARDNPGVFVSTVQPGLVAPDILAGYRNRAAPLDEVERSALTYLVAFDLDRFELGFSIGTIHPRVGWSDRVPEAVRDPALPGPDGIGDISPLVATGMVPPAAAERTAATFTGGFKRSHGAFRTSPLAYRNHGTHYGFLESGVVLSKLQPGLATLLVGNDGRVDMKTWQESDNSSLREIRFARQNGVPLVEPDPGTGVPRPGELVARWGLGNWSGSQDQRLRTLRAGACLVETPSRRFLLYGYFSGATPSAMARVFQAYGCRYAMQLDINALEHTYLALYHLEQGRLVVEHLITGMEVLDKKVGGGVLPRFLGFADNRDFFYLLRRKNGPNGAVAPAAGQSAPADAREHP